MGLDEVVMFQVFYNLLVVFFVRIVVVVLEGCVCFMFFEFKQEVIGFYCSMVDVVVVYDVKVVVVVMR